MKKIKLSEEKEFKVAITLCFGKGKEDIQLINYFDNEDECCQYKESMEMLMKKQYPNCSITSEVNF